MNRHRLVGQKDFEQRQQQQPNGRITVDYVPEKKDKVKKFSDKAGEFVDYEEVK